MNKSESFLNRYKIYKEKIQNLCNEKDLDFKTVIKIAGFVEYAEVLSEACEWYDKNYYCDMILSGKSDKELEKIYGEN